MLKKIATISLLTFLFFNWVGCWLFISWFENRETAHFVARLDRDQYNADQLIVLKVSAEGIPYSNPSATFERADGEVEVGNIHYRYVRKRLYNDSVEYLCLPDREGGRLRSVRNDLVRLAGNIPDGHGKTDSRGKTVQLLLKVLWQDFPELPIGHPSIVREPVNVTRGTALCPGYTRIGKQPPRAIPA